MKTLFTIRIALIVFAACLLNACGGGSGTTSSPAPVSMSGTVTGLKSGSVVIDVNGANPVTLSSNGGYSVQIANSNTNSYALSVISQPVGQSCTISSGYQTGVVDSLGNVQITCATETLPVSVTVSGLQFFSGAKLVLSDNNSDQITMDGNGQVTFDTPIQYLGNYSVAVAQQPAGQICHVMNGAGTGVVAPVSDVSVVCTIDTYTVSVNLSGLNGGQVTLTDNGSDSLILNQNGSYTFAVPIPYGGNYAVVISQLPVGETCVVTQGSGYGIVGPIGNVDVSCST